ncbi:MAG: hypothetical protein JSV65_19390 [Armatimonadota bacterium]|nr:MAG: hypothetical protein JSV65_19390 [Armatimonadota bacterium]
MADLREPAGSRRSDLEFSAFVPARAVTRLLGDSAGLRKAAGLLRTAGVTKVYLDVFRGYFPPEAVLRAARDSLRGQGFAVSGGITTVAGKGCGKPSSHGLYWLCWSARASQEVIARASDVAARLFDEIIVDDFLCTMCRCAECDAERRGRDWPQFYREQMVDLARRLIIGPAKRANPNAVVIIKYPQWYDRFHRFGYDVREQPRQFDLTWAGTETRDPEVEYVQPYQAYFNHRWLRTLAGKRMGGAWFDRINTSPEVFVQQAYQSVLAGAKELVLFDYRHEFFAPGAPHMTALYDHFERLCDLARAVAGRKPVGVHAYKPPDSDGGDEAYVFDYLGMFGIPLVPCSEFPRGARAVFLPQHAASDPHLAQHSSRLLKSRHAVLVTGGLLERLNDRELIAEFGCADPPTRQCDDWAFRFHVGPREALGPGFVHFTRRLNPTEAEVLAAATASRGDLAVLTERRSASGSSLLALNAHTMRYAPDSTRVTVGEPVPLIHLPDEVVQALRARLLAPLGIRLEMPSLIGFYPFDGGPLVFENFGRRAARVKLALDARRWGRTSHLTDILTRRRLRTGASGDFEFSLAAHAVAAFRIARPRA